MSSLAPAQPGPANWLRARLRLGRPRLVTVVLIALVASAPPAYLAQTGGALTTGYNIQRLQAERNSWKVRNQQLEVELAKARSLAWIEAEAVNRLGMQKPAQQTVIHVDVPPPAVGRAEGRVGAVREPPLPPAPTDPSAFNPQSWLDGVGAFLAALIIGP